jgi:branched-subunit amino acid transport protein
MTSSEIWLIIFGGMAVTYATRLSFFFLPERTPFPPVFRRGLRFVAPAVLAAILVPQVLIPPDAAGVAWSPRVPAAIVAALVGLRTRNAWLSVGAGMLALWVLQAVLHR